MTKKVSSDISRRLCDELTAGRDIPFCCLGKDNALNLMYLYKKTKYIMPKVIVEYDRTVFVEKAGNVRVTFDENIRCSVKAEKLFENPDDLKNIGLDIPYIYELRAKYAKYGIHQLG